MIVKKAFSFFTTIIFCTFSVLGMEKYGASGTWPVHALESRENRARNEALNARTSNQEESKSFLEQDSPTLSSTKYSEDDDIQGRDNEEGIGNSEMRFQTPVRIVEEREQGVQSAPDLRRKKRGIADNVYQRNVRQNTGLDRSEIERLAWFNNYKSIMSFSQTSEELKPWIMQEEENEDPENIGAMRQSFMRKLEQCYGKDLIEELFEEERKQQFFAKQGPLSFEERNNLISELDLEMAKGRDYLRECQTHTAPIEEMIQAFDVAKKRAQEAQEDYEKLNGSPWQHRLLTGWYAIRTLAGIVSTSCMIALVVTFHHGVPVILGASSFAVGYFIDPANVSRFVGCFFIPDNFNNMRTSWKNIAEAQRAAADLKEKKAILQFRRENAEKVISHFRFQHDASFATISPSLKRELEQSQKIKSWTAVQKKVEAFLGERGNQQ